MKSGGNQLTPFVLQCGHPLLPISLAQLPLTAAAEIPTKDDCDALLTEMDAEIGRAHV